jgi:hypothetical protein
MVVGLFTTYLLSLLLPIIVLAGPHGPAFVNRHHGLARRAEGNVELYKRQFSNARMSFYDAETGQAGSCGQMLRNSGFSVAVNVPQMQSSLCGRTVSITCNGKQTTATVQDTCPGCPYGGLDLTEGLFAFFADKSVGILYCEWHFGGDAAPPPPAPLAPSPTPTPTPTPPPPPPTPSPPPFVPPPSPSISIPSISIPALSRSSSNTPAALTQSHNSTHNSTAASTSPSSTATSSSIINYATGIASGLAQPTGSAVANPDSGENIQDLYQVFIAFAGLITAAHNS